MEAVWNNRAESVYDQQTQCWVENDEAFMAKRIQAVKDHYKELYARVNIPFPAVFDAISSAGDFGKAFGK